MLDVLEMGSLHLPATSHVRSGHIRHRSALCAVVGVSLGPLVVVRRYASSLGCRWAHLSSFGAMHRRWVVTGPYSSLLGLLVSSNLARTRSRWWAHSPSLSRGQGLLIIIGRSPGPASGLVVVRLSYSSSLGLRSFILASFVWPWLGWAGRVLFDALVLGETLALSI